MKKSNILMAVVTILALASAAKAEERRVDFDGVGGAAGEFTAAAAEQEVPAPGAPTAGRGKGEMAAHVIKDGCSLFCQNGYNDDCSCKDSWQDIWEQAGGDPAYGCLQQTFTWTPEASCFPGIGAAREVKWKSPVPVSGRGVEESISHVLLTYCDTYPEFASSVLPAFKRDDTKMLLKGKALYLIAGNRILKLDASFGNIAEKRSERLTWQDGLNIVNGGAAVINTVFEAANNVVPAAVENYYAHQYNNPHENQNGGSGSTYHAGQGGGSNYDVNRKLN